MNGDDQDATDEEEKDNVISMFKNAVTEEKDNRILI